MKPLLKRQLLIAVTTTVLLLAGCSGGESGTGATANNQTTQGVITGFGSIFVNGVEYNTDQASVSIDGLPGNESSLAVGMVVTIVGSVDNNGVTGTANQVINRTEVEGLVFQNNISSNNTLNVMGQTIHVSNDTRFKSDVGGIVVIGDLVANDTIVEISGFSDGQGNIYATYVRARASGGSAAEVKLHGVITGLSGNADSGSFMIGSVQVAYTTSTNFEGFSGVTDGSALADGIYVSVESSNYSNGAVQASEIDKENPYEHESEGTDLEIEGIVTDASGVAAGAGQFVLNGKVVNYDTTTVFKYGTTTDITVGVKLEVDGVAQADGSLLANEIDFRMESNDEFAGSVITVGDNMLTINDGIIDKLFVVNGLTQYEDEVEYNHYFHFDDIVAAVGAGTNMVLEVKFYVDPQIGNVATSVERVM